MAARLLSSEVARSWFWGWVRGCCASGTATGGGAATSGRAGPALPAGAGGTGGAVGAAAMLGGTKKSNPVRPARQILLARLKVRKEIVFDCTAISQSPKAAALRRSRHANG